MNEWLKGLRARNYDGAEAVLGWSFYSQGSKERTTSADEFLDWASQHLGLTDVPGSGTAKAEAIADALAVRKVLLVLDGLEPLQHGPGRQLGYLKDQGIRALLRRLAMKSSPVQGRVLVTTRIAVADLARWKDVVAPVIDLESLFPEAGKALLQDNGVQGTDGELVAAAADFGGHPLALGLLASFLRETQRGDVRRRDRIRQYLGDPDNPRHDHAKRVMESYEREWLREQPVLLAAMHLVGLFDRPASADCIAALLRGPAIVGFSEPLVGLEPGQWSRAVSRLRDARLLAPVDPLDAAALDTHPLVREWFGERLRSQSESGWTAAHKRLYEHLRDTTAEGERPTLEQLAPLYAAIVHGGQAGLHHDALDNVYVRRICRHEPGGLLAFYSRRHLGAFGNDLAALSNFFSRPFETPVSTLPPTLQTWVLAEASVCLRAQGRVTEAIPGMRRVIQEEFDRRSWVTASVEAGNLSECELLVGELDDALTDAETAVRYAYRAGNNRELLHTLSIQAEALFVRGQTDRSEQLLKECETLQRQGKNKFPVLYSRPGHRYCELLLSKGRWADVLLRANKTLRRSKTREVPLDIGLDMLMVARATSGQAMQNAITRQSEKVPTGSIGAQMSDALDYLHRGGQLAFVVLGLRVRAAFRRVTGDWSGSGADLDEAEELARSRGMLLHLCDVWLDRARLALAEREGFAPLGRRAVAVAVESRTEDLHLIGGYLDAAANVVARGYDLRRAHLSELRQADGGALRYRDLPPAV